jgi:hypothetical protein
VARLLADQLQHHESQLAVFEGSGATAAAAPQRFILVQPPAPIAEASGYGVGDADMLD